MKSDRAYCNFCRESLTSNNKEEIILFIRDHVNCKRIKKQIEGALKE